ncbi:SYCY2 protein, partial [Atractosteus spatula]|nr:SYCY2 protein [Atractosteus spatula]
MDWYWQCGAKVYDSLPPHWRGVCALVTLHHSILIVPVNSYLLNSTKPLQRESRVKLVLSWADRYGPDMSKIPEDNRLFTAAEMTFSSGLSIQAVANTRWLQITRYEMYSFINITLEGLDAIKQELRGVRLMALQNRFVLDLQNAASGGVCALGGDSCCTYIPTNDDYGNLTLAIQHLKELKDKVNKERGIKDSKDLISWLESLFGQGFFFKFMFFFKLLTPIIGAVILVFLYLCCCTTSIIPMLRNMVMNMFAHQYVLIRTQESEVWEPPGSPYEESNF